MPQSHSNRSGERMRTPLEHETYSMVLLRVAVRLVELDMRRNRYKYAEGFEKPLASLESKLRANGVALAVVYQIQLVRLCLRQGVRLMEVVEDVKYPRIVIRGYRRFVRGK